MNISSSLAASYAARTAPIVGKLYASLAASGTLATPSAARIDAGPDAVVTLSAKAIQPGSARDLDNNGLTSIGAANMFTFSPENAPEAFKVAWASATDGMSFADIPTQMIFAVGLANIHYDARTGRVTSTEPRDPGWRNPYADPGYDYAGAVADLMGKLKHEFLQGLLTTAQYQHDMSFYTRLADALNA